MRLSRLFIVFLLASCVSYVDAKGKAPTAVPAPSRPKMVDEKDSLRWQLSISEQRRLSETLEALKREFDRTQAELVTATNEHQGLIEDFKKKYGMTVGRDGFDVKTLEIKWGAIENPPQAPTTTNAPSKEPSK